MELSKLHTFGESTKIERAETTFITNNPLFLNLKPRTF